MNNTCVWVELGKYSIPNFKVPKAEDGLKLILNLATFTE